MPLTQDAEYIKPKDDVDEDDRTDAKDEVAEHIKYEILAKGRWPMKQEEIAQEVGWSRTIVSQTLSEYFEPADEPPEIPERSEAGATEADGGRDAIEIPAGVDRTSYLQGRLDEMRELDG